ncbi:DinB family protein [Streptomyces evansiae]|uniref:DinB family protein n=1 Tax=Streptomyces evansiae TaxID=3075535 RepID=UPI0028872D96|nr:DinB family protein [Streptomyces sp. DSM 41859]MDT0421674.1 DinB family protein [Streptomyces sp. DSM 41859]
MAEETVGVEGTDARSGERVDPEVSVLREALRAQRAHVLGALEGLGEEELRRGVLPSGWSCLGLLRHLALDVERFWFRGVLAADTEIVAAVTGTKAGDDAWRPAPGDTGESLRALYRAEAARADAVLAGLGATEPPARWPGELFGSYRLHTVREVLVHALTETACHAGHADAVRELLDGRQWLVLGG